MFNSKDVAKISETLSAIWLLINSQPLSEVAIDMFIDDVVDVPFDVVMSALKNARKQCKGRISLGDIMSHIEKMDGRPSAAEAWATAIQAEDQTITILWTKETAESWFKVAAPLMYEGDKFNASRGFIDKYNQLVADSRLNRIAVEWIVTQGTDKDLREKVVNEAIAKNLLTHTRENPCPLLPHHNNSKNSIMAVVAGCIEHLQDEKKTHDMSAKVREEHLQKMRSILSVGIKPKPTFRRNSWATYNEADELGIFVDLKEQSFWMEKAANSEDMRDLQIRIFNKKQVSNEYPT